MMQVGAVSCLLRQKVIDPPNHRLEMPVSSKRHSPSLAKGPDGMGSEVVKSVRHPDLTFRGVFGSGRYFLNRFDGCMEEWCYGSLRRGTEALKPRSRSFDCSGMAGAGTQAGR